MYVHGDETKFDDEWSFMFTIYSKQLVNFFFVVDWKKLVFISAFGDIV
jgi:hypothetical protein